MSATLFAALQPDAALTDFLLDAKRRTHDLVGPQQFLDDPPHLTVYLAWFAQESVVAEALHRLGPVLSAPGTELTGWHVFEGDPLTGNHSLVCQIAPADQDRLRDFQSRVVEHLAPLRDRQASAARYAARLSSLSPQREMAIREVGFPYLGEDWHPHFTVASVRPADWPAVWHALKDRPPRGRFHCPALQLYRLEGERPVLRTTLALCQGA